MGKIILWIPSAFIKIVNIFTGFAFNSSTVLVSLERLMECSFIERHSYEN